MLIEELKKILDSENIKENLEELIENLEEDDSEEEEEETVEEESIKETVKKAIKELKEEDISLSDVETEDRPIFQLNFSDGDFSEEGTNKFRKQVLKKGEWYHTNAAGGKLTIDDEMIDKIVQNFNEGLIENVAVPVRHTEDPIKNTGEVVNLKKTENGLEAVIEVKDGNAADKITQGLIKGISASIDPNYVRKDTGESVGPVLRHAALVMEPFIKGLGEFVQLSDEEDREVVQLSENKEDNIYGVVKEFTKTVNELKDKIEEMNEKEKEELEEEEEKKEEEDEEEEVKESKDEKDEEDKETEVEEKKEKEEEDENEEKEVKEDKEDKDEKEKEEAEVEEKKEEEEEDEEKVEEEDVKESKEEEKEDVKESAEEEEDKKEDAEEETEVEEKKEKEEEVESEDKEVKESAEEEEEQEDSNTEKEEKTQEDVYRECMKEELNKGKSMVKSAKACKQKLDLEDKSEAQSDFKSREAEDNQGADISLSDAKELYEEYLQKGRVTPSQKDDFIELAQDLGDRINLSDSSSKVGGLDKLRSFLDKQPQVIDFEEKGEGAKVEKETAEGDGDIPEEVKSLYSKMNLSEDQMKKAYRSAKEMKEDERKQDEKSIL